MTEHPNGTSKFSGRRLLGLGCLSFSIFLALSGCSKDGKSSSDAQPQSGSTSEAPTSSEAVCLDAEVHQSVLNMAANLIVNRSKLFDPSTQVSGPLGRMDMINTELRDPDILMNRLGLEAVTYEGSSFTNKVRCAGNIVISPIDPSLSASEYERNIRIEFTVQNTLDDDGRLVTIENRNPVLLAGVKWASVDQSFVYDRKEAARLAAAEMPKEEPKEEVCWILQIPSSSGAVGTAGQGPCTSPDQERVEPDMIWKNASSTVE